MVSIMASSQPRISDELPGMSPKPIEVGWADTPVPGVGCQKSAYPVNCDNDER